MWCWLEQTERAQASEQASSCEAPQTVTQVLEGLGSLAKAPTLFSIRFEVQTRSQKKTLLLLIPPPDPSSMPLFWSDGSEDWEDEDGEDEGGDEDDRNDDGEDDDDDDDGDGEDKAAEEEEGEEEEEEEVRVFRHSC
jgi:hypothetical protein